MRVVLDINILVSAMIVPAGKPAAILDAWLDGKFTLLTCAAHVDELRATLQKPKIADLVKPHKAGRLVNQIRTIICGPSQRPATPIMSSPATRADCWHSIATKPPGSSPRAHLPACSYESSAADELSKGPVYSQKY